MNLRIEELNPTVLFTWKGTRDVDVDYDHLTSSGTSAMTGGFVGRFAQGSSDITTLNIYRCKNYGNVNSKSNYTGGFIGCNLGEKSALHVAYSANYGDITSSYTGGVGGIIGGTSATTFIEKTFNAGDITTPGTCPRCTRISKRRFWTKSISMWKS